MNCSNNKIAVEKAKALLQAIIIDKDDSFIENEFAENCVVSNNYGISLGTASYKSLYKNWHEALECKKYKITEKLILPDTITLDYIVYAEHIGAFRSINPTGKDINFDVRVNVTFTNTKITAVSARANSECIVKQLTGVGTKEYHDAISHMDVENYYLNLLMLTQRYLRSVNIIITMRQLQCLILWATGMSDSEMGIFLDLSTKTVNHHQESLRAAFNLSKKQHIFEKLDEVGAGNMLNQCLVFILKK